MDQSCGQRYYVSAFHLDNSAPFLEEHVITMKRGTESASSAYQPEVPVERGHSGTSYSSAVQEFFREWSNLRKNSRTHERNGQLFFEMSLMVCTDTDANLVFFGGRRGVQGEGKSCRPPLSTPHVPVLALHVSNTNLKSSLVTPPPLALKRANP